MAINKIPSIGLDNVLTATGDIPYASAASTPSKLGIGSTGNVLTVAGGVPTWAAPAGGGITLISSGTLSTAEVSITSIPATYVNLMLFINNPYVAANPGGKLQIRINNNATAQYGRWFFQSNGSNGGDGASNTLFQLSDATNNNLRTGTNDYTSASVTFFNYTELTSQKSIAFQVQDRNNSFNSLAGTGGTYVSNTSAISSIQISTSASTFSGGTYTLYGVK